MVKPGGIPNMLGQWRVLLKQAEESARTGRIEDALELLVRPEVVEHRQSVQLRGKLARELMQRAKRRAEADDLGGALDDLDLAERHGAAPDALAEARLAIAERAVQEIEPLFELGDPARGLERIEALARRHVSGPGLRRLRELAEAWKLALDEIRRGEFGRGREALERASRLASGSISASLAAAGKELELRQESAQPRVERLYRALGAGSDWGEILAAAEAVLEVIPEHAAARQARSRSWQQIGALNPAAALPARHAAGGRLPGLGLDLQHVTGAGVVDAPSAASDSKPAAAAAQNGVVWLEEGHGGKAPEVSVRRDAGRSEPGPRGRLLLWVDAVGGYLLCLDREIVIGRAGHDSQADVPILGDLSRRHASLVRQGDGYTVRAHHPAFINGRQVVGTLPIRDRDVLRLGSSVELVFRQPSPVSATARLEIVSRHRLPLAVDGVILMAETCILGPSSQSHVVAPKLKSPLVIYRQGAELWCRLAGPFEVDGRPLLGRAALGSRSQVRGEGFSFSLEPLGPKGAGTGREASS